MRLLPLLISVLLLCCACGTAKVYREPEKFFSLSFSAQRNGKTFKGNLNCTAADDIRIEFTDPGALRGFSVRTEKDGFSVNAFGIKDVLPPDILTSDAPLVLLTRAVSEAVFGQENTFEPNKKTGGFSVSFTSGGIPVRADFGEDGFLLSLNAPSVGFSAEFTKDVDKAAETDYNN